MHTPAHLAASLLVWRGEKAWGSAAAIALGALTPDLPMFGFYAYEKMWLGRPERQIWSELYFQEHWQLFFDIFNSIPLTLVLIVTCKCVGSRWGYLCAASALLHMACDLPVHHDDAHRHFLPLSNWRFTSPISYWDPRHHGLLLSPLELVFGVGSCIFVAWRGEHAAFRWLAFATLALYALGIGLVALVWVPELW